VSANSSFRTMAHQQALCNANYNCAHGNYATVAKPGTSNHQMGLAIDFASITATGGSTCSARATQTNNGLWNWLKANAGAYGYRQYSAEAWHWDPTTGSNMCS
jgi:LAS superfamily LD-carboxypeptidase LdcB